MVSAVIELQSKYYRNTKESMTNSTPVDVKSQKQESESYKDTCATCCCQTDILNLSVVFLTSEHEEGGGTKCQPCTLALTQRQGGERQGPEEGKGLTRAGELLAFSLQPFRVLALYFFLIHTCQITIFHLIKRYWC